MLRQLSSVWGLLLSTFFMLAATGLSFVVVPLRAQLEGWSPTTIGFFGAAYAAGFMAGCFFTPKLVLRVGHVRVYAVLSAVLCMSVLLHSVYVNVPIWLVARALGGFALAGVYMVVESWLNEQATNETRGSVFSIYMIVNMVGLVSGQFLLISGDPATTVLFILSGVLYAAAVIPTGLSNASSPQPLTEATLDLRELLTNSPVAVIGAVVAGAVWGSWSFHAAIYAADGGLAQSNIAFMLVAAMAGGVLFQFPIGKISDVIDRRIVIIGVSFACALISGVLVLVQPDNGFALYALVFCFGGTFMPIYSLVVAHGNDYADPADFVEVSSGLLIVYGVGTMIGPVATGVLMDAVGRHGLFASVGVVLIVLVFFAAFRLTQRGAAPEEERIDFNYAPTLPNAVTTESYLLDPRSDEDAYSSYEIDAEENALSAKSSDVAV
ncbi:MAG: MFS transporter [Pseudomonadota bacterium]